MTGSGARDRKPRFRPDLYQGSAGYYDKYRLGYPEAMLAELVRQAKASERGRLLDLACGTGQLAFPLRHWFREVWAVDQEPDMVELVRAKAAAEGAEGVRPVVSSAETLDAEPGCFELVVVGNAFHRLDRDLVANGRQAHPKGGSGQKARLAPPNANPAASSKLTWPSSLDR